MSTQPDLDTQAQAIIFAAVYDDKAACDRFGLSGRSLRRYRKMAREEGSELAKTVRLYGAAMRPDVRAVDFLGWMQDRVRDLTELFIEKAREVNPNNPEGLRAITEHVGTLLDHAAALTYIEHLFTPPANGPDAPEAADSRDWPPHAQA